MTTLFLLLSLLGCPTATPDSGACPEDVDLGDADMGCTCGDAVLEALPGCGGIRCEGGELVDLDEACDTAGCKSLDGCD